MTTAAQPTGISEQVALWHRMYRQMLSIRLFENQVNELYTRALMPGLAHLYIGEEAVAVGVCEALKQTDYITSTHRGHGHCLAKGASPDRMFAELLGKEAGYCKGKGGSMHIADPTTGNLGAMRVRQRRHRDRGRLLGKASAQRPCVSLLFWRGCSWAGRAV
jgi:pyruvate dehydrogenase E1 component alpha subunit